MRIIAIVVLALGAGAAWADCPKDGGAAQAQCLEKLGKEADAQMAAGIAAAQKAIDADPAIPDGHKPAWKQRLQTAQVNWLSYRELDCAHRVQLRWWKEPGAPGARILKQQCFAEKTERRLAEIRALAAK
jgi:uncharacterized protein YecT (DUF1311 family)